MKKTILTTFLATLCLAGMTAKTFDFGTKTAPSGATLEVDSKGFIMNGRHPAISCGKKVTKQA